MTKPKVTDVIRTCTACPTQYEGLLDNGDVFYFRYRGGYGRITTGKTMDEAVRADWFDPETKEKETDGVTILKWSNPEDPLDGYLTPEQALEKMSEVFDTSDLHLVPLDEPKGKLFQEENYVGRKDGREPEYDHFENGWFARTTDSGTSDSSEDS